MRALRVMGIAVLGASRIERVRGTGLAAFAQKVAQMLAPSDFNS